MTVRVNKQPLNIREKLSELDYAHVPYEKMPLGSIIQVSSYNIPTEVTFNTTNFATGYTHPFKPKNRNSKIIHYFWSKTYLDNVSYNAGHDYRLLGGSPNLDIGSHETIIQASWQNYFNRVQYARDYYPPLDFITEHKPHTTELYNYTFQGRRYAGLSSNADWRIGRVNMSAGPANNRGCWVIYEVSQ
jgi:hypothetical protein